MNCLLYVNHTSIKLRKGRKVEDHWIEGKRKNREKEGRTGGQEERGRRRRKEKKNHTAIASGKLVYGNIGTREGNYPCRIKQSPEITPHIHTNLVMPQMALRRKEHSK